MTTASTGAVRGSIPTYRRLLPNGLTLLVRENHANPTISIQGLVKAGALFDGGRQAGLARFTASMLDQGTSSRDALALASSVEDIGASLHFEGGAESVTIRATMLAEDLDAVLGVLAEELRAPVFPAGQVEKVRADLLNDVRLAESTTSSVAARRASELIFPEGHPFHEHRGGSEASLRAITRDDLAAFHRARYRPDAVILALVGDVTPEQAVASAERVFGDWARPAAPLDFAVPAAPPPARAIRRAVSMPGRSQADVVVAFPGVARTAPDYDAVMMMNYILGGASLSSRLMENLRDAQGLVYGVYSMLHPGIGAGPLQIRAGTNPKNVERCVVSIAAELKRLHDEGPTDAEMEAAKGYLTGVFPVRLEANSGVAAQILAVELYALGADYLERYESIVGGITKEATAEAARRYLTLDRYVLAVAGDVPEEAAHAL
ncbi:MAG TPA: pitrilysin family protein [Candidatus Eisenbacteria bacterium]|nr:pitrilysin family protein [Candidatus Eisenbacteria bacterium]